MPKKKTIKKKAKKKKEIKKPKKEQIKSVISSEEELKEVKEEKSLEKDVSDEEIQTQRFRNFSAAIPSAPILEKIADAPVTPDVNWQLSESREEKKEPKREYILEEEVTEKYTPAETTFSEAPVLRTERVDISSFHPEPSHIGRKFTFSPMQEISNKKEDYETLIPSGEFIPGKEKEEIGRKYKPKHR